MSHFYVIHVYSKTSESVTGFKITRFRYQGQFYAVWSEELTRQHFQFADALPYTY